MTRNPGKLNPMDIEDVREDVLSLAAWRPVQIDLPLIERAWSIHDRFRFAWWDSMIVAAALHGNCRYLLSEDLSDGQVIDGVKIVSPFVHSPDALLR